MQQKCVLHVEDEPTDALFVRRAFQKAKLSCAVQHVQDGEMAIDYLSGHGPYWQREAYPLPDVVLLDLKLPLVDGFEVLAWLQAQEELRELPVIVLSGSPLDHDIRKAKALGAKAYFIKSIDYSEVVTHVANLLEAVNL